MSVKVDWSTFNVFSTDIPNINKSNFYTYFGYSCEIFLDKSMLFEFCLIWFNIYLTKVNPNPSNPPYIISEFQKK